MLRGSAWCFSVGVPADGDNEAGFFLKGFLTLYNRKSYFCAFKEKHYNVLKIKPIEN